MSDINRRLGNLEKRLHIGRGPARRIIMAYRNHYFEDQAARRYTPAEFEALQAAYGDGFQWIVINYSGEYAPIRGDTQSVHVRWPEDMEGEV
jgi:hypothetical protein